MRKLFSNRKTINLVIDDYALRMVELAGGDKKIRSLKEKLIPKGLLEHGRILDEMEFYHFMQETVQEWKIQRRNVRFYAPDSLIIMKKVEFPADLEDEDITGHFYMELGRSLYLPFENPIFDIFPLPLKDSAAETREGLLFAAPEEEIRKISDILEDVSLNPIAVDLRPIGIYRYYYHQKPTLNPNDTYLFIELNLKSIHISIFSSHRPEFLRYSDLDVSDQDWKARFLEHGVIQWEYIGDENRLKGLIDDQMIELERILNFYRFSIHKGKKEVTNIYLLGDFPDLDHVQEKMTETLSVPVQLLDTNTYFGNEAVPRSFIPALGLALKGESNDS